MKMDVFCADIVVSLDTDARIQKMRTFCNWNKDWQQPSKGVDPRGDAVLEERLKKKIFGNQANIQRDAVLDTLSRVPQQKGKEWILPYCYQRALRVSSSC